MTFSLMTPVALVAAICCNDPWIFLGAFIIIVIDFRWTK